MARDDRFGAAAAAGVESYFFDPKDVRSFSRHNGGSEFVGGVLAAVKNIGSEKYPQVKLSKDNSISFFTSDEDVALEKYETDHNKNFREEIKEEHIVKQLEYHALGLTIGGKKLLETKPSVYGVTEHQFNISPENFDGILKLSSAYGYRADNSILKLKKNFTLKDGVIRLFPVTQAGGGDLAIQAAGCQLTEMPTLQLMRLLPNYETEILPRHREKGFSFHRVPDEVESGLVSSISLPKIMKKIFSNNGIDVMEHSSGVVPDCSAEELAACTDFSKMKYKHEESDREWFGENPDTLIIKDKTKQSGISVVEMDAATKDFYLLYGNISAEALNSCQSVEVKTLDFLLGIQEYFTEQKAKNEAVGNGEEALKDATILKTAAEMIAVENERLKKDSVVKELEPSPGRVKAGGHVNYLRGAVAAALGSTATQDGGLRISVENGTVAPLQRDKKQVDRIAKSATTPLPTVAIQDKRGVSLRIVGAHKPIHSR